MLDEIRQAARSQGNHDIAFPAMQDLTDLIKIHVRRMDVGGRHAENDGKIDPVKGQAHVLQDIPELLIDVSASAFREFFWNTINKDADSPFLPS